MEAEIRPKWYHVNMTMLPLKIFYFFFRGGSGTTMAFEALFARQLGVPTVIYGFINAAFPFLLFLANFICGLAADYFKKPKMMVLAFLVLSIASKLGLLLIPKPSSTPTTDCNYTSLNTRVSIYGNANCSCLVGSLANLERQICPDSCNDCKRSKAKTVMQNDNEEAYGENTFNYLSSLECSYSIASNSSKSKERHDSIESKHLFYNCSLGINCKCDSVCHSTLDCTLPSESYTHPAGRGMSTRLWVYAVIYIISELTPRLVQVLTDAACCECLKENAIYFGKERLWGTIGKGLGNLLGGCVVYAVSSNLTDVNYSPAYYLYASLFAVSLLFCLKIKYTFENTSQFILKDAAVLFRRSSTVVAVLCIFFTGCLMSLANNYRYWYLEEIGASSFLLGLMNALACFIAEIPCFYFSGWIIKKIGCFNTMNLIFPGTFIRFIGYSYLTNPWYVLPLELFDGQLDGLFFATKTAYAKLVAPPGTEATIQAVLEGVYFGIGNGVGSIVGGICYKAYGGRLTFRGAGYFSLGCWIPTVIISLITYKYGRFQGNSNNGSTKNSKKECGPKTTDEETI